MSQKIEVGPINAMLVTVAQAAQLLQVSERTIQNLMADGKLPSVLIGNRRRLWLEDIRDLALANTIPATVTVA